VDSHSRKLYLSSERMRPLTGTMVTANTTTVELLLCWIPFFFFDPVLLTWSHGLHRLIYTYVFMLLTVHHAGNCVVTGVYNSFDLLKWTPTVVATQHSISSICIAVFVFYSCCIPIRKSSQCINTKYIYIYYT